MYVHEFLLKLLGILLLPGIFILGACLAPNEDLQAVLAFAAIIIGALMFFPLHTIIEDF